MSKYFVIVNLNNGKQYRKPGHSFSAMYESERGAKIARTKLLKIAGDPAQWEVMSLDAYKEAYPVKMVPVRNLMSGEIVMEAEDTPRCCSVGSELYWTM